MLAVGEPSRVVCFVAIWLAAVVVSSAPVIMYSSTPGRAAQTPSRLWPQTSALVFTRGQYHLVIFLHPHCPCSRATIEELSRLMAQSGHPLRVDALFIRPAGAPADWEDTDIYRAASRIPGVTACADPGGLEARRFGAETSGQTYLFGPDGALHFRGGITAARGHAGLNLGVEVILKTLRGEQVTPAEAPVLGCALHSPDEEASS